MLALDTLDVAWTAVPDAIGYDLVTGDLGVLRSTGGDFTQAVTGCVVNDTTALAWSSGEDPAAGEGFFYLVRAEAASGSLSYDTFGVGQVQSRDPGIEASPDACP